MGYNLFSQFMNFTLSFIQAISSLRRLTTPAASAATEIVVNGLNFGEDTLAFSVMHSLILHCLHRTDR